jgi:hypothetical protein
MPKYNKKIVKRICDLISRDAYTIAEICAIVKISESCYYNWQANVVEFGESIARARDQFDQLLVKEAKNSLLRRITGYEVDEKKTVYVNDKDGKPVIKEQTVTKKHYQSDVTAAIFALTNKASDEYQNRQHNEVTGKGGKDLFAGVSDEDLNKRITELESKLKAQ